MSQHSVTRVGPRWTDGPSEVLLQAVVEAITNDHQRIVLWGLNPTSVSILSSLQSFGLLSRVEGIVDLGNAGTEVFGFRVICPRDISTLAFDAVVVTDDSGKESALLDLSKYCSRFPRILLDGTRHLEFSDPTYWEILNSCPERPLAFGYPDMLVHIYQSIRYLLDSNISGVVAEFGVFRGGTLGFIARTLRRFGCTVPIYGFDTFTGFPERRNILDLFSEKKYEHTNLETVRNQLEPLGVKLIRGNISDTFTQLRNTPLMFTFFDTDNYTPTRDALDLCYNQTVRGGVLAFDHYYCDERWLYTLGERIAVKEALSSKTVFNLHGTGIFLKPL